LAESFQRKGEELFSDPWQARDAYIEVVLGGSGTEFLDRHGRPGLTTDEQKTAIGLLDIQHHAMLMYTSCGWFFDDISGLEAVFVLRHAGRVAELARQVLGRDLEPDLLSWLEKAQSNVGGETGRDVYQREVAPFIHDDA
jgi:alpha-amylase/alpha-mannosidase (GH57 family)